MFPIAKRIAVLGGVPLAYYQKVARALGSSRLAHFPFWDLSGTVAAEIVNGRNGGYTNVALAQTGIGDGRTAVTMDGSGSDYINIYTAGLAGAFNPLAGLAFLWYKPAAVAVHTDGAIRRLCLLQADSNNRVILAKDAANGSFTFNYIAGGTNLNQSKTQVISANWLTAAITWDKTANEVKLYMDGKQFGSTQAGLGNWVGALAAATTLVGAGNQSGGQVWNGGLAHCILTTTAPTPATVKYLDAIGRAGQIVFEGDSLMIGTGSTLAPFTGPVAQLSALLSRNFAITSVATAGESVNTMNANAVATVDVLYDANYKRNIAVLWGGTNDIAGGSDAATTYSRIVTWCSGRRAAGFRVIVCTLTPASAAGFPPNFNTTRSAVNVLIRANWTTFADGIADLGANTDIGEDGDELNVTYYNADKVHMKDAGYAIVAGIVKAAIDLM